MIVSTTDATDRSTSLLSNLRISSPTEAANSPGSFCTHLCVPARQAWQADLLAWQAEADRLGLSEDTPPGHSGHGGGEESDAADTGSDAEWGTRILGETRAGRPDICVIERLHSMGL